MDRAENYRSIGAALRSLREERGHTRGELARFFGADEGLIEDWEEGLREPTISECLILAGLWGVSLDEMFSAFRPEAAVPEESREQFEREARISRMSRRWYD